MTKEATTQDVIKCIDKWTGIRDGKIELSVGSSPCRLCKVCCNKAAGIIDQCNECPLKKNGFGCIVPCSNWWQYDHIIDDVFDCYIDDVSGMIRQKLLFHIGVMIKHLEICLDQLRGDGPLSVTKAEVSVASEATDKGIMECEVGMPLLTPAVSVITVEHSQQFD
jgi:hypothetical protein